jgi:hypothetical protein
LGSANGDSSNINGGADNQASGLCFSQGIDGHGLPPLKSKEKLLKKLTLWKG